MRLTCSPNSMFLASPRLELDFHIGHFADFERFRIDSNLNKFGQVNIDLIGSFFTTLGSSKLIYRVWTKR